MLGMPQYAPCRVLYDGAGAGDSVFGICIWQLNYQLTAWQNTHPEHWLRAATDHSTLTRPRATPARVLKSRCIGDAVRWTAAAAAERQFQYVVRPMALKAIINISSCPYPSPPSGASTSSPSLLSLSLTKRHGILGGVFYIHISLSRNAGSAIACRETLKWLGQGALMKFEQNFELLMPLDPSKHFILGFDFQMVNAHKKLFASLEFIFIANTILTNGQQLSWWGVIKGLLFS